jgi:hypothetical protein
VKTLTYTPLELSLEKVLIPPGGYSSPYFTVHNLRHSSEVETHRATARAEPNSSIARSRRNHGRGHSTLSQDVVVVVDDTPTTRSKLTTHLTLKKQFTRSCPRRKEEK